MLDKKEQIREMSIEILKILYSNIPQFNDSLPYLFSLLTDKLNSADMYGVDGLDEDKRPKLPQKPTILMETNEDCEEVRMQMCELLHIVISRIKHELIWTFVQPIVDNVRALLMDPFKNVQFEALEMTKTLTLKSTEVIFH